MTGDFEDEPDWVIDQTLRRKRDMLKQKWEEREQRLQKIRAKEKRLEERATKRRRREELGSNKSGTIDEEAEFLLSNSNDGTDLAEDDPLFMFSKETRDQMAKLGLLGSRAKVEEEEVEDEIKVGSSVSGVLGAMPLGWSQLTLPTRSTTRRGRIHN